MAIIPSGIWPIDATITSGTELAAYLNDWVQAFNTQSANATRPPTIQRGGIWAKTLGASDIALMMYDGTTDHQIGSIVGGSASFGGGTNAGPSAPATPAVGDMWFDTSAGVLKIYDGANWSPVSIGTNSGTTPPAAPATGDMWFDTNTNELKVYDGANWVSTSNVAPITLDTVNTRVGIDQATPQATLDVNGNAVATTSTQSITGSVTLDFDANQNFVLTLTGNVTLANPTTGVVGQSGFIVFIQDGTGGRTVSLSSVYQSEHAAGLILASAASATDIVPYAIVASGKILIGNPQRDFG